MIRLYAAPGSCSICAHVALIEGGLDHRVEHVVLRSPTSPLPAVNPLGKVPTIVVDDAETITQSSVVLPYIADLAPDSGLLPSPGSADRRRVLEWLGFLNSDVHPALKMLAGADRYCADPESLRDSYRTICGGFFRVIEEALAGRKWLVGDRMTIADIYAAAAYGWARQFGMSLHAYPAYRGLSARFEALPSAVAARKMEADFVASTMTRHAFMSPEWLEVARDELATAIAIDARAQKLRFTVVERYIDMPDHAPRPEKGEPALWLEVDRGAVTVRYGIEGHETADLEIDCGFDDAWRSVCLRHGPELEKLNAGRLASGRLKVRGNPGAAGPLFNRVHDRIADRTIAPPRDD